MSRALDGAGIDKVLQDGVDSGAVPHAAAIAADRDGIIYEGGAGVPVAGESGDPVSTSTQFRIMSMTKMVATTAALQQVERGELDLDAPVEEYRPEFAELQVLEGFDGDVPRLRPPASKATVRHLVTHTSGLGYWFFEADLKKYEEVTGLPNVVPGLKDALKAPLVADPGTQYVYGISTDWLGLVVEAVAGTTLDVVVKEHITGPLDMGDTMFVLDDGRKENVVPVHVRGEDGSWTSVGEILTRLRTGGPAGTGCTRPRGTTSASSARCCAGASSTGNASCRRPPSTPPSRTRSATSTSRPTSRPSNRRPPTA